MAARDHVGITTLYQGWSKEGAVYFASEMKCLQEDADARIIAFPPGHYYLSSTKETVQFYKPKWYGDIAAGVPSLDEEEKVQSEKEDKAMYKALRDALEKAVKKRLMSEVPYGVLLSGGLDSSLIASIAVRMRRADEGASSVEEDDDIKCELQIGFLRKGVVSCCNTFCKLPAPPLPHGRVCTPSPSAFLAPRI